MNLYVKIIDDAGKEIAWRGIDLEQYKKDPMYRLQSCAEINHMLKSVLPSIVEIKKKVKE